MALQPITIRLSDKTLQRAQVAGLLAPDRVKDVFLRELERQEKVARFFEMADQLQQLNQIDPITPEDVEAEIAAVRAAASLASHTKALAA
jgi:hypothetical protein